MSDFNPKNKSQGLGDTIAKFTNFLKIDKVADAIAKLAGMEGCGCDERRELLNHLFPYDNKTRRFKVLKQFNFAKETYFEGQEIIVDKQHPIYKVILALAKDKVIEEI